MILAPDKYPDSLTAVVIVIINIDEVYEY